MENFGPRSFLYGPRCARSVLPRPQANIPQYGPRARLVRGYYYTTQAVRRPITKINQSKCSIAGSIFSKDRTLSRMIPHLCLCSLCFLQFVFSFLLGTVLGEYLLSVSFVLTERSVLSRPRANILPVRPSRLVNKIYVRTSNSVT